MRRGSFLQLALPLLLVPLACAGQELDDMAFGMGAPINAARITDSDLSCEQLYAESVVLEQRIAAMPKPEDPLEASARMQKEMMESIQKQQSAMRTRGLASSVLSMVPGVGGLAASAVAPRGGAAPDMAPMAEYMEDMRKMQVQARALAEQQARSGHVTSLFLDRGCKVSTLDPPQVQAARRQLDGATVAAGPDAGETVPATVEQPVVPMEASGASAGAPPIAPASAPEIPPTITPGDAVPDASADTAGP